MSGFDKKVFITESIVVATTATISLILQWLAGNFPVDIFAFPLNIVALVLWVVGCYTIFKSCKTSALAKSLLSIRATWLSLGIMAAIGIYLGLQPKPNSTSWPIVAGVLFTLTHLLLITMRGWRTPKGIRWRFTLLHVGLLIALGAGFWGAPDRVQLRTILTKERPATYAYHLNGTTTKLGYAIELSQLETEYAYNGMPTLYEATIKVENKEVKLRVNHPYNRTLGEKIYLVSVDHNSSYCIVEIIREPWQWFSLAGIVLLLAGAVMLFIRGPRHTSKNNTK